MNLFLNLYIFFFLYYFQDLCMYIFSAEVYFSSMLLYLLCYIIVTRWIKLIDYYYRCQKLHTEINSTRYIFSIQLVFISLHYYSSQCFHFQNIFFLMTYQKYVTFCIVLLLHLIPIIPLYYRVSFINNSWEIIEFLRNSEFSSNHPVYRELSS